MIDSTGTGPYALMATCKYRLPCGYCELKKKKICTADNPFTITPIWNDVTPNAPAGIIIRCKNCKHYHTHDRRCKVWNHGVGREEFCSRGEWKDDPSHPFADDVMMG